MKEILCDDKPKGRRLPSSASAYSDGCVAALTLAAQLCSTSTTAPPTLDSTTVQSALGLLLQLASRLEVGGATAGRLSKELRGKTRRPGRSILHGTFTTPRAVRTCAQLVLLTQPRRSALNAGYVPQNPRAVG